MQDAGYFAPGFDRRPVNKLFRDNVDKYLKRNNLDITNKSHVQEAGISALLTMYGDMININQHNVGESSGAKHLNRDTKKKVMSDNPC